MNLLNRLGPAPNPKDFKRKVAQGNAARDMRDWAQAEEAYRSALDSNGSATPIWVQYGHALKEQGKLAQALDAYRTALRLDVNIADTHLQLGHALKLSGNRSAAAEAYWQALKIDPSLTYAAMELNALGWREEDLPRHGKNLGQSHSFEGENELALLLAAVRASDASQFSLLVSNPVFALSGRAARGSISRPGSTQEEVVVAGPLNFKTRADFAAFNELDPNYQDEDVSLTCHMTQTWHRFDNMRHEFHLNSDRSRLAFIAAYYKSLRWNVGPVPDKLLAALNMPTQAHGPVTRFLFALWQADFRDQDLFDIQREEGYINFLTEVVGRRSWAKHLPDELVPGIILTELHQPATHGLRNPLSKAQYSMWNRSEAYRKKYSQMDDWAVRQAFSFDVITPSSWGKSADRSDFARHDKLLEWPDFARTPQPFPVRGGSCTCFTPVRLRFGGVPSNNRR
jgi:tetratricopeptide (TPR) repeat protein